MNEERQIGNLIFSLRKGDLLIPNFQRDFVWDMERWQAFMASLVLDYPLGSLLIGTEAKSDEMLVNRPYSIPEAIIKPIYAAKAKINASKTGQVSAIECIEKGESFSCEYLLDGQQRLTSTDLIIGCGYHLADGSEISPRFRWFLDLNVLGFRSLSLPDLVNLDHEAMCNAFIGKRYTKNDIKSPYFADLPDDEITSNCQKKSELLLPMDKLFVEDDKGRTLKLNEDFWQTYFTDQQNKLMKMAGRKSTDKNSKRDFNSWVSGLRQLILRIPERKLPIIAVKSADYGRLAGIFQVVNESPMQLSTFDLLVARSGTKDTNLRHVVRQQIPIVTDSFSKASSLLPNVSEGEKFSIKDFWSLGQFLGEREFLKTDQGDRFPDGIAKPLSQLITLHVKLGKALGEDWATRATTLSSCRENAKDPKLVPTSDPLESARSILRMSDWAYSDNDIVRLQRADVQRVQKQAINQLFRALLFARCMLGITRYSHFPYRLMDLPLACALTDPIWKTIQSEPQGKVSKRLQLWFWASIFGGAYERGQDARVLTDIPRLMAYVKGDMKWSSLENLQSTKPKQYRWDGSIWDEDRFHEDKVEFAKRVTRICAVAEYSDETAMCTVRNESLRKAVSALILSRCPRDFKCGAEWSSKRLHAGRTDIELDHLFAVGAWKVLTGEAVARSEEHPINSPINVSPISSAANKFWSNNPSFLKLQIKSALDGETAAKNFLDDHLISPEVAKDFKDILDKAHVDLKAGKTLLRMLLEKRHESLRLTLRSLSRDAKDET